MVGWKGDAWIPSGITRTWQNRDASEMGCPHGLPKQKWRGTETRIPASRFTLTVASLCDNSRPDLHQSNRSFALPWERHNGPTTLIPIVCHSLLGKNMLWTTKLQWHPEITKLFIEKQIGWSKSTPHQLRHKRYVFTMLAEYEESLVFAAHTSSLRFSY